MGSYLRFCRLPGFRTLLAATEGAGSTRGALSIEARPRSALPSLLHWYSTQLPPAQGAKVDLSVPVLNFQRQEVGTKVLAGDVFNVPVRKDILHRVVRWQLAKRQQARFGPTLRLDF